jgi:hypothetical protein
VGGTDYDGPSLCCNTLVHTNWASAGVTSLTCSSYRLLELYLLTEQIRSACALVHYSKYWLVINLRGERAHDRVLMSRLLLAAFSSNR